MRLIDVETLELQEFFGASIPQYAILSHTWGGEEVTFQDWQDPIRRTRKAGFAKIEGARRQAQRHGFRWLWVDTNCIDKCSSAELSEAINSMFAWYKKSAICLAYLEDVITIDTQEGRSMTRLGTSRWFTRGWTLQELLAPQNVDFFDRNWRRIGSRNNSLVKLIEAATGIESDYLTGKTTVKNASVAKKMFWVSRRQTTREEDIAYCMLGLFDINMPLLYGEGTKAFVRLQEEIIKVSIDHTLFSWQWQSSTPAEWASLLAPDPSVFKYSRRVVQKTIRMQLHKESRRNQEVSTYVMTNAGLSIRLPVLHTWSGYLVALQANTEIKLDPGKTFLEQHWLPLYGEQRAGLLYVQRQADPIGPVNLDISLQEHASYMPIIVRKEQVNDLSAYPTSWGLRPEQSQSQSSKVFGCFFMFHSSRLRDRWLRDNAPHSYIRSNTVWMKTRKLPSGEIGYEFMRNVFKGQEGGSRHGKMWGSLFIAVRMATSSANAMWFAKVVAHKVSLQGDESKKMLEELVRWAFHSRNEQHAQVCVELDIRLRLGQSDMVDVEGAQVRSLLLSETFTRLETEFDDAASDDSREVLIPVWNKDV